MSDLLEATETQIERAVAGTLRKFVFLNAYDRAELLREDLKKRLAARSERRQKLIDNLKLAEIKGEQMFVELERFDDAEPNTVTEDDWIAFVAGELNRVRIYQTSLNKSYNGEAEELAKQTILPLADVAKICGLVVQTRMMEASDPNPQGPAIPPTYSTTPAPTETGSRTDAT